MLDVKKEYFKEVCIDCERSKIIGAFIREHEDKFNDFAVNWIEDNIVKQVPEGDLHEEFLEIKNEDFINEILSCEGLAKHDIGDSFDDIRFKKYENNIV